MKTIAELWSMCEQLALPINVSDLQRRESKRMFYAGFAAALQVSFDSLASDEMTEQQAVLALEGLHQEAQAFANDVLQGRA